MGFVKKIGLICLISAFALTGVGSSSIASDETPHQPDLSAEGNTDIKSDGEKPPQKVKKNKKKKRKSAKKKKSVKNKKNKKRGKRGKNKKRSHKKSTIAQ